ncbi:hypothetical protein CTAYLR_010737 [Chrysophaeum taylorii]|uniref:Endoplasmic reticulum vesicle transporter N-terminal domain-containing protein n=1 Tax=Chrysophaeum taylorii TaxID=2483200 RepID=A0AAD7U7G9_9STRA|nr:hypothetical protein CTAYLR_010737 [Chrysophaeum taylorii]
MPNFRFDALARAVEGVQERTISGAIVTLGSVAIIAVLLVLEVKSFLTSTTHHHIGVDDGDSPLGIERWTVPDRLPVRIYMTFAHVACEALTLEIDATRGDFEPFNGVEFRPPTEREVSWTNDVDLQKACTLDGRLTIGKVSANFHVEVADGAAGVIPQLQGIPLAFSAYANQVAHLERRRHINISHKQHYLVKVIPTLVDYRATNQYSLAEHFLRYDAISLSSSSSSSSVGVFFSYDFFPVMIQIVHKRPTFAEFLVSICVRLFLSGLFYPPTSPSSFLAIIGGVFAVSSIIDGIIFQSAKVLSVKRD